MSGKHRDLLDHTIQYLAKREGIDKTLKLIRYTSRLVVALSPEGHPTRARFSSLEASIGTSRKALRLGKFLQNVADLRKAAAAGLQQQGPLLLLLELVAAGGEGVYYFLEQFVWLMKAGFIGKELQAPVGLVSAWAELGGYCANISLNALRIRALLGQEARLGEHVLQLRKDLALRGTLGDSSEGATTAATTAVAAAKRHAAGSDSTPSSSIGLAEAERDLARAVYSRRLRMAFVAQDLADSLLAINDIRSASGKRPGLAGHPATLALAGLLSAAVSSFKYWNA